MENQTVFSDLLLSGLSDLPSLQLPLFLFFLLIYLLTLTWNLLIVSLIVTNSRLHTPMYFFLGNLASLDLCFSSVTVPRMLFDLHTQRKIIVTSACVTQVFFFLFFASAEVFLLAVMSYDRYVAICHPLHYMQIMRWRVCKHLSFAVWLLSFTHSSLHTLYASKLTFCKVRIVESFFCDLPQLFHISCSDIFINLLLIFALGCVLAFGSLTMTFLSYVSIFKTVLKMHLKDNRSKVFSTCTSHLAVVLIFFGSVWLNYFQLIARSDFSGNKVMSVFYMVITPLLNPLIYSLRNQTFRAAIGEALIKVISCAIQNPSNVPNEWIHWFLKGQLHK
ncbi:olfactory receptor 1G1-like [Gastrophryne carolinensis]